MKKRILSVCCIFLFLVFIIFIAINQENYTYKSEEIDENLNKIDLVNDFEILVDNKYFSYDLLDETNEDYQAVIDVVKPISLNITDGTYMASAFIYKIDEDYIYAATARHAIIVINGTIDIIFYNDQVVNTRIDYETLKNDTDLAIFRFRTNSVPKELLYTLKEAYIDTDYYSQLIIDEPLIEYSENHGYPFYTMQSIKLVNLTEVETKLQYLSFADTTISTTRGARAGMSGCPLIDYQGRVLGITSYICFETGKDYFYRMDRLNELETNLLNDD